MYLTPYLVALVLASKYMAGMEDLKAHMQKLMQQRQSIEAEIAERSQRLNRSRSAWHGWPISGQRGEM